MKRKFDVAADLGCGRGYVSRNVYEDMVGTLYQMDMSEKQLVSYGNINFNWTLIDFCMTNRFCLSMSIYHIFCTGNILKNISLSLTCIQISKCSIEPVNVPFCKSRSFNRSCKNICTFVRTGYIFKTELSHVSDVGFK